MPPPQAQEGGAQGSMDVLWGAVLLIAVGILVWWQGKEVLISFIFTIRAHELSLIDWFWPGASAAHQKLLAMKSVASEVSYDDFLDALAESGEYFRLICSSILGFLGFYLMFLHVRSKFKTNHTMQTLIDAELHVWKHITPVAHLNLVEQKIMEGPWAMSASPLEFAKKHNLLIETRTKPKETSFLHTDVVTISIDKDKANRVFASQMGRPWTQVDDLKIHEKALFAVFAARSEQDREGASQLLTQISDSARDPNDKLNFAGTEELLKKHAGSKPIAKLFKEHAYVLTVMASMLELGRLDGIIATAEFLWLKPYDRTLWYMLNNIGRQTAYPEVAGPFAHWLIEKRMHRKLHSPMIREASKALEAAINDVLYTPPES